MNSARQGLNGVVVLLVLCAGTTVFASSTHTGHSFSYTVIERPPAPHNFALAHTHKYPHHHAIGVWSSVTRKAHWSMFVSHVHHHKAIPTHTKSSARHQALSHDALARFDMSLYAAHHLGVAVGKEHTYGSTTEWSKGWAYRWMDFVRNGETVRVCHAMKSHDSRKRYIAVWDPAHSRWTRWQELN